MKSPFIICEIMSYVAIIYGLLCLVFFWFFSNGVTARKLRDCRAENERLRAEIKKLESQREYEQRRNALRR